MASLSLPAGDRRLGGAFGLTAGSHPTPRLSITVLPCPKPLPAGAGGEAEPRGSTGRKRRGSQGAWHAAKPSVPKPFMALYSASASWLASKPGNSFTEPL